MSRTEKAKKNIVYALIGQIFGILLSFGTRTAFIHILNANYLGLNGLFSNVLSLLSLAELGLSNAIIFSLYSPLAENNTSRINEIMRFYKTSYRVVGLVVACLGLIFLPFINNFINVNSGEIKNLEIIYLLFLGNSVVSYFNSYKRALIIASQNQYIETVNLQVFNLLKNVLQIVFLFIIPNFIVFLVIQIVVTLFSNYSISRKADKLFPYLRDKISDIQDKLDKKSIYKNILALSLHKFSGVLVFGITNLLISKYIDLKTVGVYSNYFLIISSINTFIMLIFSSLSASIGNLKATSTDENTYLIFKTSEFFNLWLYSTSSVCLVLIVNPFIEIWLGKTYLFDDLTLLFLVLNFFVTGRRTNVLTFKSAFGLFWQDRYKPIFESIFNVILSVFLIQKIGLVGAFIATLSSSLLTAYWVEPYVLYKHGFKMSALIYFKDYLLGLFVTIVAYLFSYFLIAQIHLTNVYGNLLLKILVVMVVSNITLFMAYRNKKEFDKLLSIIKQIAGLSYSVK
jgi:O-antigen/teichoic acid export membrane protein